MTETNTQYNIPSALPIASPPTYLILIDSRVTNYQDIINAKQQGVHHIVFDVPVHGTYAKILFKSIEDKIAELGVSAFTSIGLVQHNDMRPNYEMFGPLANHIKPIVTSVSSADPYLQSWNSISIFITMLRLKYGIQYFDMMACAIYSNPDWKYIIDQLTVKTGVTIRASTDDTGSAALGGDWFLESHTGVNLKEYYFTAAIDSYNGILVTDGNNAGPSISTTKKLLLIDHLIPDISVIINSINDDTYCLVFNSSNDTYDTILSKLRFLTGSTRYILDNFYYAEPGSASDTAPVLSPSILQTENNWPFYPESTAISIQKPVFFQREKAGETMTTIPYGSTTNEPTTVVSRYIPRDKVRITDLGEIYEIARSAGEVPSSDAERIRFDCVGILQHAPLTNIGYKLTNMIPGQPAIIQNIQTLDANLSSWASVGSFIATLKSAYHMTTLDLMACALYSNEDWKYIIDNLAIQQNITIRASIDNTGSSYDGGNWILETQDINLTTVYFTDEIYKWSYILPSSVTALRFDGVDDAVNVGVPAWTYSTQFRTTMTVECWFKTSDTNNQKGLSNFVSRWVTAGYANSSMFLLAMETTGTITFWITNASGTLGGTWTNGSTYKDAQWHHVAVTYNSSSGVASMYIDGSLINSSTTASFGLLANNTGTRLIFGSDDAGAFGAQSDRQFRGSISDIRIWNVVRSASEISDNYRRRLIGTETGLVGYWKLNHGNGTGWGSYSTALDSTSTRAHGTLIAAAFGGSPSSSWVVSDISFNPRISTLTLGANNGVYNLSDSSFSFIDPSSNSLGDFTYAISSGAVGTISNGSATMKTVYATSGATVSIPTLSLYEFPEIASLSSWKLDISFTVTGGSGSWRALIGDMYNEINSGRGWGIWVSSSNRIHWSWNNATVEPDTISVNLNTAYVLTVAQSSGTITITLRTVSSGATQTGSFSVGSNVTGKGPVTIGGWRSYGGEIFPGTISYVNVSVPTNQRVITLASSTGGTPATITATQSSFLDFATGTKTASLTVNSNTITPTISSWTIADVSFGVSPFTLTPPTSDSSGGFRYQSSNTSVADVCGNTVTVKGAGQTTITATQDACGNYLSGTRTGTLTVRQITPPINAWTIADVSFGVSPFTLTPPTSDSSGGFRYQSSNTSVADVCGNTVTVKTAGQAIITVTQDACGNYLSGTRTGTLTVRQIAPTINAWTIVDVSFGVAPFTLTPPTTDSSGGFGYQSSNTSVADVCGNTVTVKSAGQAIITATQDACGNYLSGTRTGTLTVRQIAPTINAWTIVDVSFGVSPFTLTPPTTDSSGGFGYQSSNTSVADVCGNTVTVKTAGQAIITATQDACGNYLSGTRTGTLTVNPIAPPINAWTIADVSFGVSPFTLTPPTSDSSGGFRYQSSNTSVADVCGNTVTVKGAGQTTITATQDACGNYLSGTRTATLTVNLPTPTFSTSFANVTKNYLDSSFALVSPVSNSIGEFSFSSNNAAVGTINPATTINALQFNGTTNFIDFGSNITELGKGSFTIELWIKTSGTSMGLLNCQDSDTLWEEGEKSLYIDSAGLPAFVGYGNDFIYSNRAVNDNTWHHIAVSWEYTSGTSGTRTIYIDGINRTNTSHPYPYIANKTNFGTFVFGKPTNSENVNYFNGAVCELRVWNIARSATDIFQNYRRMLVGNESGLVAYNRFNQGTASGTNTSITTVTNNKTSSGYTGTLSGNFALTGSSSNWVSGVYIRPTNDVNVIGAGTATITVTQAANGDYTSQTATATLTVRQIAPTISTWTIADVSFGVAPFTLTRPTSDSSGGFGYQSSNTSVADVCGNTVTVKTAGQAIITATQDTCGNYLSGTRTGTLTVRQIAPTINTWTIVDVSFGVAPFTLTPPTSDSSGGFGYQSSNTSVVDVCGNTVTVKSAGQAVITATQDACGNYLSGTRTGTLTVRQIAPTINTWTIADVSFRVAPFTLTPPISDSSGGFGYQSSNTSVADVCGNTVTVKAAGQAVITATQDACGNYLSGTRTGTLTVRQIAPTINTWTIADVSFGVAPFNLTPPTSDSSGVFRYYTNTPRVATVTEVGVVTIVGAGYTIIFAIQDACGNFYAANNSTALVVLPIAPTLGPLSFPTSYFNDASFFLTRPTTDSGGSFDYSSDTPSVATISDTGRVTIFRAGRTTISVTQYASGNFTIGTVTGVFEVLPVAPVISPSTIIKYYGDPSFNIRPTSTNSDVTGYNGDGLGGGLFSFSGSSNSSVITVFDTSYVGIAGIGSASITVYQTATRNFTSGSQTIMVTINKGSPVLSTLSVSSNKTYGSAPFSILTTPTSESNGAITYSSSDMNVATIDNSGVITLVASGYVTFIATQASTAFYNLATKASNTMTVYRRTLQLTRIDPSNAVINKIYGDSYFTVSATNESNGGAFTYETDNPSVAGIINASTGVISVVSVGSAIITARRAQTAQYTSYPIAWTVEVARAPTTLTGLTDLSYNVTTAPFTVSASSASNSAVTYSLQDPSSTVLTIHPTTGLVTLKSPGRAVIVASQVQSALYLAPANITATITVSSAGNALQGATLTNTSSFTSVDLSGASLAGVSITNTTFSDAKLSNANFTNAVITSANFTSANLSGATLSGATITGATFTSTSLKNADLSGATLTSTTFTGSDLSGANLTGIDASGASFANAKLNNVDMTGAKVQNVNFTNTSIKGANIVDVSFSPLQKLQLLRNSDNRDIGQIIIPAVSGTTILSAISETSPLRAIANLDLTSASVSVSVVVPTTSTSPTAVLPDVVLNVTNSDKFYLPINESEYFQIEGVKYSTLGGVVRNYATNAVVDVITYNGKSIWLLAGSIVGLVLQTNTLNTSSFVVPAMTVFKDTAASFMPTTLPTTNSESAIIYSSNNPFVATIDASSGLITMTGNTGFVKFTATQVQNSTYEPGRISSNYMSVDKNVNLTLVGLNQSFNLSTLALLDASAVNMDATDATSIYYVRLSDINNVFKYQTDSFDVNDITSSDIKYYVFHRKWPAELKINPAHSMMDKAESLNMLGNGEGYVSNKSLLKHDFIRYISLRLFNTIHGVDLFRNESDLQENSVYFGETVRYNIDNILSGISTTSNSGTMAIDSSGNKYLTNDSSGNTNLCRELMRQIAASASSRFYNNDGTDKTLKNVPFIENDTIVFKLIIQPAVSQNSLTGVGLIPSRSYTIKLVIKNTVTAVTNANTAVVDSEMYPNSYPYSSSVTTYPATSASSAVYNIYSPPAPIPFSRFGYNGWYYTNSTTWVNVAPTVRNHIKWLVPANTGASTVANLKYIRINLKIHNNASLPYLMIYTEAGSSRKYSVNGGNSSLANGNLYSLYMNFNSYLDEPAMIGYSNAALAYSVGSGTFSNNEVITSIAIETESNATASNIEFTLSSMIVGEQSTSGEIKSEKEYGFEADVPATYP